VRRLVPRSTPPTYDDPLEEARIGGIHPKPEVVYVSIGKASIGMKLGRG
jgi:hypothetical protein